MVRTDDFDDEAVFEALIRNAWTRHPELRDGEEDPAGSYPAQIVLDGLSHYRRADPSLRAWGPDGVPLDAADYGLLCEEMQSWLLDDQQGMEQVYDLLELRKR
ncbi:MAG: hypothetical protein AAFX99_25200 [Myxococcota bacterium]